MFFSREEEIAVRELYDYLDIDYGSVDSDMEYGYLTLHGSGEKYAWYFDGVLEAAINIDTLEITEDDAQWITEL